MIGGLTGPALLGCMALGAALSSAAQEAGLGGSAPSADPDPIARFLNDVPCTTTVATPHIPWARPFHRGTIRLFAIPTVRAGREVAELAQRLDLDLTTVTVDPDWGLNALGLGDFALRRGWGERWPAGTIGDGAGRPPTFRITDDYLRILVNRARHYDCHLIPPLGGWTALPADVRDAILHDVANGAGLILVGPNAGPGDPDELNRFSPLRVRPDTEALRAAAQWRPAGRRKSASSDAGSSARASEDAHSSIASRSRPAPSEGSAPHFFTRGVPVQLLHVEGFRHRRYDAAGMVVLATETGDPIVAVRPLGRGRVVALAYESDCLAPRLHPPAAVSQRAVETLYSLLCRAVVWASRREAPAAIERLDVEESASSEADSVPPHLKTRTPRTPSGRARPVQLAVTVTGAADTAPPTVNLELTLRNAAGRETLRRSALVALEPGASRTIHIPLPEQLDGGLNVADVRLSETPRGAGASEGAGALRVTDGTRTYDWSSVPVPVTAPATVDTLTTRKTVFQPGEEIEGEAEVRTAWPAEVEVRVTLEDRWNRLLAGAVLRQGVEGAARFRFLLRPQVSLSATGLLRATAWVNGQEGPARETTLCFEMPPRPGDPVVIAGEGQPPVPEAWWEALERQLLRSGVTALAVGSASRASRCRLRTIAELQDVARSRSLVGRGLAEAETILEDQAREWRPLSPLLYRLDAVAPLLMPPEAGTPQGPAAHPPVGVPLLRPRPGAPQRPAAFSDWLRGCRRALRRVDPFAETLIAADEPEAERLQGAADVVFPRGAPFLAGWPWLERVSPTEPPAPDVVEWVWRQVLEEQRAVVDLGWRFGLVNPDLRLSDIGRGVGEAMEALNGRGLARLILGARPTDAGALSPAPAEDPAVPPSPLRGEGWGEGPRVLRSTRVSPSDQPMPAGLPGMDGGHATTRRIARYADGSARYLASAHPPPGADTLAFDREGHIYDCIAGRYLGRGRQAPVKDGARPLLLALLPYRVTGMRLEAPARIAAGSYLHYVVRLDAGDGFIGRHVVAVDAIDPAGVPRPEYHRNLEGGGGVLAGVVPLAWNDPPGQWTLQARDAVTGISAATEIEVRSQESASSDARARVRT